MINSSRFNRLSATNDSDSLAALALSHYERAVSSNGGKLFVPGTIIGKTEAQMTPDERLAMLRKRLKKAKRRKEE